MLKVCLSRTAKPIRMQEIEFIRIFIRVGQKNSPKAIEDGEFESKVSFEGENIPSTVSRV